MGLVITGLLLSSRHAPATTNLYVYLGSTNPVSPFTSWATAATNIQDAIDAASAGDTVFVSNGVYQTGGRVVDGAMTNRVVIDKAITVQSVNGPAVTIILGAKDPVTTNGDAAVRCVYVGVNATLIGFTLSGGATRLAGDVTTEMSGGGSWNAGGTVISNCVYVNNDAYNGGAVWGGTFFDCTFQNNTAAFAGGGALFGEFHRCKFISNTAEFGGGADNATVYNSLFTGNHATDAGGATYFENRLVNCTIVGNSAVNSAGGSAYDYLTNCIVYFNTAPANPNHFNSTFAYSCTTPDPGGTGNITNDPLFVTLDDPRLTPDSPCVDQGNTADAVGPADLAGNPRVHNGVVDMGAYELQATSPYRLVWTNSPSPGAPYVTWDTAAHTIQDAIDVASSGETVVVADGVYATGSRVVHGSMSNRVAITNAITVRSVNGPASTIIQGAHHSGTVTNGDAAIRCVYVGANATLAGFTLTNGATRADGDLFNEQCGGGAWSANSGVVRDCIIAGNNAFSYGGGAAFGILTNCVLIDNRANTGGATFNTTAYDSIVTGNVASAGGGAYGGSYTRCELSGNQAATTGGGAYLGVFNDCTLRGNQSGVSGGGATQSSLSDCLIEENTSSTGGGVVGATLFNCIVSSNTATTGGGASGSTLNGCLLIHNSAGPGSGGGAAGGTLNNCTVADNIAGSGGGVFAATVNNSINYFNTATTLIGTSNTHGAVTYNFSCTAPPAGGSNIDDPPLFVNRAGGNYRLASGSPCIDRGENGYVAIASDLDGNPRIRNGRVDIGAYEAPAGFGVYGINGALIPHGSSTPFLSNGTDFGPAEVSVGEVVRVFTISNALDTVLSITSVSTSGTHAADFTILSFPAAVEPGTGSNFVVRFATSVPGLRSATVQLQSDDPYRPACHFAVQGLGALPAIQVRGLNDQAIPDGDTTPSLLDGTHFGTTVTDTPILRAFTIANTGTLDLVVGLVSTGGPGAAAFEVLSAPSLVTPGASSNLVVQFDPPAVGIYTAVVAIANNDPVLTNYTFTVAGIGTVTGTQYVATDSPSPTPPYTNWATAAHTIMEAMDWAVAGNLVLVSNGVYETGGRVQSGALSNRVVISAGVTLESVNGPETTMIRGTGPIGPAAVRCVYLQSNATISGFTILDGATMNAGDIAFQQGGGGVFVETGGIVDRCIIVSNSAALFGGGVIYGEVRNSLLAGNTSGGDGGGAYRAIVRNCTVADNSAAAFGGGTIFGTNWNSIIYFNAAATGANDYQSLVEYSCITPDPGGAGNITNDPNFLASAFGNYRLLSGSACRDAGANVHVEGDFDLDGQPRIIGVSVDMGAYERLLNTVWHVATNGNDAANGESWLTAVQTIQAGIDLAADGERVVVSNGVYDAGSRVTPGFDTSNRVVLTKNILVESLYGPADTVIKGVQAGDSAESMRGVYISTGTLAGFTLTAGYAPAIGAEAHQNRSGGGAYAAGGIVSNCWITGNSASWAAGGVMAGQLFDCRIWGNTAPNGGGAVNALLWNSEVFANHATTDGGGIYNSTANQSSIYSNTAVSSGGGAIFSALTNCAVWGNSAIDGGGARGGSMHQCDVIGNSASLGGGVWNTLVTSSLVMSNYAGFGGGGALFGTLQDTWLIGNQTGTNHVGGGAQSATLDRCVLIGNWAHQGGGAYGSTLRNCLLLNNSANFGGGSVDGVMRNCTVVGNTATEESGGTRFGSQYNSIIYFNNAPVGENWSGTSLFYNCTYPMPTNGVGNITNNPVFVDMVNSNFALAAGSPARDMGDNANAPAGFDLAGNTRIVHTFVDMGAYEFQDSPPGDYDGDGMTTTDERIAGSDPLDPNDTWGVNSVIGPASVGFNTVTGRVYAVDRNDDLIAVPQVWTEFTNNVPGTGGVIVIDDPDAVNITNRNYRARVQRAP